MKLYIQHEQNLISDPPYCDLNSITNLSSQNTNLRSSIMAAMTVLLFLPDLLGIQDGIQPRDPPSSAKIIRPAKIYLKKKKRSRNGQTATTPHSFPIFRLRDECVRVCIAARVGIRLN
jgi:hypothetical protein